METLIVDDNVRLSIPTEIQNLEIPAEIQNLEIPAEIPEWVSKLSRRGNRLNKQYERAYQRFASVYNEFLISLEDINTQNGTNFTFKKAGQDFGGINLTDMGSVDEMED